MARVFEDDSISVWLDRLPTDRVTPIMEGHQFGQGDRDPDHPDHEQHARELPAMEALEAVGVTRCGEGPIQEGWEPVPHPRARRR